MKKEALLTVLFLILFSGVSSGDKSPFSDFFFFGEMPDAAAIAMGGAYTASSQSPFAAYWNPAAIARISQNNYAFSYNLSIQSQKDAEKIREQLPLEGRGINFIAISAPEIGVYYRRLSNRVDEKGGEYLDGRMSIFGITVAVPQEGNADFGMNINYITGMTGYYSPELDNPVISSAFGWGLDWGLIYRVSPQLRMGLSLHNAPAYVYWGEWDTQRLPLLFRGGVELYLSRIVKASAVYETGAFEDRRAVKNNLIRFGIEQRVGDSVALRAGVYGREKDFDDRYMLNYTAGVGYVLDNYRLDVALERFYPRGISSSRTERYSMSAAIPF